MPDYTLTRRDFMHLTICTAAGSLLAACTPDTSAPQTPERESAMTVGIIVYSQTGHTLSVATTLHERLTALGRSATLQQIETVDAAGPRDPTGTLKTAPSVDGYDAIVFGSPAWGGVPAWPTTHYLDRIPSLQDRRVAILVAGALPATIGRNQTIAKLTEICEGKGATVLGAGSVCWFSPRRKHLIEQEASLLTSLLYVG